MAGKTLTVKERTVKDIGSKIPTKFREKIELTRMNMSKRYFQLIILNSFSVFRNFNF